MNKLIASKQSLNLSLDASKNDYVRKCLIAQSASMQTADVYREHNLFRISVQ